MPKFVKAAPVSEIPAGQGKLVEVEGQQIALFQVDGSFYAIENICPHRGGPLAEGHVEGRTVTCPWHAWRFDLGTGCAEVNPEIQQKTFPVKVEAGDLYVGL